MTTWSHNGTSVVSSKDGDPTNGQYAHLWERGQRVVTYRAWDATSMRPTELRTYLPGSNELLVTNRLHTHASAGYASFALADHQGSVIATVSATAGYEPRDAYGAYGAPAASTTFQGRDQTAHAGRDYDVASRTKTMRTRNNGR